MNSVVFQVLLIIFGVLAINGVMWIFIARWLRKKAARQVARYGEIDPGLADGWPIEEIRHGMYIGARVDGERYVAPGYWMRGSGRIIMTEEALVIHRGAGRPAIVPRQGITDVERRNRFAGRGHLGKQITVVHFRHGGGRFSLGMILGRDQRTRTRWERMLRPD